jgi:protocatechuate 3,4-dioxygenase alpha subunit
MATTTLDSEAYLPESPSQTAGPYVHIGLIPHQAGFDIYENNLGAGAMAGPGAKGERVRIEGRIFDGAGGLVRDALIEAWQADANGRYPHPADTREGAPPDPAFRNWGRTGTDFETGLWSFDTIKPGRVPGRHGFRKMAPHVNLWVVARGINLGLSTRLYFADEDAANAEDPVLNMVDPPERRRTLLARRDTARPGGAAAYVFDLRLQGPDETVFFDI